MTQVTDYSSRPNHFCMSCDQHGHDIGSEYLENLLKYSEQSNVYALQEHDFIQYVV